MTVTEPRMHTLEKALKKVALEGCQVADGDRYWQRDGKLLHYNGQKLWLSTEDLARGLLVQINSDTYDLNCEDACHLMHLLRVATAVQEAYNDAATEMRQAEAERVRKEREEREAKAKQEQEQLAARKEQLLMEFIGEKGRIRLRGMKRWRPVTVDSREGSTWRDEANEAYVPVFKYVYDKHGYTEEMGKQIRAFEIKVGSRYQTVWNDGQEDLNPWDRNDKAPAPMYQGMEQLG